MSVAVLEDDTTIEEVWSEFPEITSRWAATISAAGWPVNRVAEWACEMNDTGDGVTRAREASRWGISFDEYLTALAKRCSHRSLLDMFRAGVPMESGIAGRLLNDEALVPDRRDDLRVRHLHRWGKAATAACQPGAEKTIEAHRAGIDLRDFGWACRQGSSTREVLTAHRSGVDVLDMAVIRSRIFVEPGEHARMFGRGAVGDLLEMALRDPWNQCGWTTAGIDAARTHHPEADAVAAYSLEATLLLAGLDISPVEAWL